MSISRVLIYKLGNSEKLNILLSTPRAEAPNNMDGKTIYKELRINVGSALYLLNNCHRGKSQNKLVDVNLIILNRF